jgi:tRNA(Ile)-lysidine synthase
MLSEFEKKILRFINTHKLLETDGPVLLAVSGGADSVTLVSLLARLKQKKELNVQLAVGHVNHKLRGQSANADEEFVAQLAEKMDLKTLTRTVDTKAYAQKEKISIETAARKLRIDALTEMAREAECGCVATAHHANDNAETIIHRLLRGTGFRGLAGIRPRQKFRADITFVRPMLCVTRAEIIDYCRTENLPWRHDHTNDEFAYTRNKIRHLLLPYLQENCDVPMTELLNSLADSSRRLYEKIQTQLQKLHTSVVLREDNNRIVFDKGTFSKLSPLLQAEFINAALASIGSGLGKITEDHYHSIASLASGPSGGKIQLPDGFCVIANHEKITFTKNQTKGPHQLLPAEALTLNIGQTSSFGPWTIQTKILNVKDCDIENFKTTKDKFIEWFDYDKLILPLTVRPRQDGDRFHPLGNPAPKKIGKFLTAAKVEHDVKVRLAVFADTQKIIWAAPVRTSELTKITTNTKKILQIKIS